MLFKISTITICNTKPKTKGHLKGENKEMNYYVPGK